MGGHAYPKGQQVPDYTGVNLQTASMTEPVPLAWGMSRGAPNLIFYNGFTVHKKTVGKGGSFFGKSTQYTYSANIILALCEGPISGIGECYINTGQTTDFHGLGFTLFTGTTPQAPWSFLTANFPSQALGYQGVAYLAAAHYNLGQSESLPSQSFEVKAPLYNTQVGGAGDADPAQVVLDFLTNDQYGAFFPAARISLGALQSSPAATTTGDSAYQTYCRALGFGLSPFIQSQEPALDILSRWCQVTNTAPVWTGYALKFIPFGDTAVTGNGVTWLPPTGVSFAFTDDDFVQDHDKDPVEASVSDWFDAYNAIAIECRDRAFQYNTVPIDWIDLGLVQLVGRRQAPAIQAHEICSTAMAKTIVSLVGQRMAYVRRRYAFVVGPEHSALEPMDVGLLTETALGLTGAPVRVRSIEERDDGALQVVVEEFPGTVGQPQASAVTGGAASPVNALVAPASVNQPIIFEPNSAAAAFLNAGSSAPTVVCAVSGGSGGLADPNWGGAVVNISADGTTYVPIGTVTQPAAMGQLTASLPAFSGPNPDTADTLAVSLAESGGVLQSASSAATAAAGATLGVIQDASGAVELVAPETATLTGTSAYSLTNLFRGLFATGAVAHASGALYARLDNSVFTYALPAAYIGAPLHFKFQSFNIWGQALQDLSTCTAYAYTPVGTGFGGGTGGAPTTPTGLTATGGVGQNVVSWAANPSTDNVTSYRVLAANGPSAPFSSATLVATVSGLTWTETGLGTSVDRTYFVEAVNALGASTPAGGVDATTSSTAVAGKQPFGYVASLIDVSVKAGATLRISVGVAWTLPATTSSPAGYVEGEVAAAPTATTAFTIQKDGVTIGTATWAASSQTPTLTKASDTSLVAGDYVDILVPSTLNGMSGAWSLTIMGTRP